MPSDYLTTAAACARLLARRLRSPYEIRREWRLIRRAARQPGWAPYAV